MKTSTHIWCSNTFGGAPIEEVKIYPSGEVLIMTSQGNELQFHMDSQEALINLKNQIDWAYESYLRRKKEEQTNES